MPKGEPLEVISRTDSPGDRSIVTATSRSVDSIAVGSTLIIIVGAAPWIFKIKGKDTSVAAVDYNALVTGHNSGRLSLKCSLVVGTNARGRVLAVRPFSMRKTGFLEVKLQRRVVYDGDEDGSSWRHDGEKGFFREWMIAL